MGLICGEEIGLCFRESAPQRLAEYSCLRRGPLSTPNVSTAISSTRKQVRCDMAATSTPSFERVDK